MSKYENIYALYKGDTFIADGTMQQIARKTDKTLDYIDHMSTPAYKRRVETSKKNRKNKSKGMLELVLLEDEK